LLNHGKIHAIGRVEEVLNEEVIESVYGVKVRVIPSQRAVIPIT